MGTYSSRYDPLPFIIFGTASPAPSGFPPPMEKNLKNVKLNILLEYSIPFIFYLTTFKTMEYSQIKIINHINDKRAKMLKILKTLKGLQRKETCCVKNYKKFIDNALDDNNINGHTMSEKDCEKFFRLGEVINTVLIEKRETIQKLDSITTLRINSF